MNSRDRIREIVDATTEEHFSSEEELLHLLMSVYGYTEEEAQDGLKVVEGPEIVDEVSIFCPDEDRQFSDMEIPAAA